MREIIFAIFSFLILGVLIYLAYKTKEKYMAISYIATLVVFAAFYLFQYGNLQTFSIKALSIDANFISAKKNEVQKDAAEIDKIKNQMKDILEEAKTSKEKTKKLEAQANETAKILSPPIITLAKYDIEKKHSAIFVSIKFKSSKRQPLPELSFRARITKGDAKILNFHADTEYSFIHFTNDPDTFEKMASDGRSATTVFSPTNSEKADLLLIVSGPSELEITGKYLKSPAAITIP